MKIKVRFFSAPKAGESKQDNQDAVCHSGDGSLVAIADGVSSSLFAKEWAQMLTQEFCGDAQLSVKDLQDNWQQWLKRPQEQWRAHYLASVSSLPWYARGSREKDHGSATFVGLKLHPIRAGRSGYWEAISVGDSCLFHIDAKLSKIRHFPPLRVQDFTSCTQCINSLPEYVSATPRYWSGTYGLNDSFLLATDALAQWLTRTMAEQGKLDILSKAKTPKNFIELIVSLRKQRQIHDDDTTLIIISPPAPVKIGQRSHRRASYSALHQESTRPNKSESCGQSRRSQSWLIQKLDKTVEMRVFSLLLIIVTTLIVSFLLSTLILYFKGRWYLDSRLETYQLQCPHIRCHAPNLSDYRRVLKLSP